jgi:hypothetical protein
MIWQHGYLAGQLAAQQKAARRRRWWQIFRRSGQL